MKRKQLHTAVVGLAAAISLVSCATSPITQPSQSFSPEIQAEIERLAFPEVVSPATDLVVHGAAQRLRAQRMANAPKSGGGLRSFPMLKVDKPADRALMWAPLRDGAHATRMSGAPIYNFNNNKEWFATDDGYIYETGGTNPGMAGTIPPGSGVKLVDPRTGLPTTDTFPNTYLQSYEGRWGFLCSADGDMYCIDLATPTKVVTDVEELAGAEAAVGFTPQPWVVGANVYAVNNQGKFYRITRSATGVLTVAGTFDLPRCDPATTGYTEYYRAMPTAFGNHVLVGSWRKHATNPLLDEGSALHVNRLTGAVLRTFNIGPVFSPISFDLDNALVPSIGFVTGGKRVYMLNLKGLTGTQSLTNIGLSQPLVINPGDATRNGHPSTSSSTYGLQNIATQVSINATLRQIFVQNCNAIFQLTYENWTADNNDPFNFNYTDASFGVRKSGFEDYGKTWGTPTLLGSNPTFGPVDSSNQYVHNICSPYFDGVAIHTLDNWGNPYDSAETSLTSFTPGATSLSPPVLDVTTAPPVHITATAGSPLATQLPGLYLTQNFNTRELLFNTTGNLAAGSSAPSMMHVYMP